MRRVAGIVIAGALTVLLGTGTAAAAGTAGPGEDGDALVVLTGDVVVPEGAVVDTVVVFDGAVRIAGRVRDAVVVFSGPVTIEGTARVGEAVVVFDGPLTVEAGAQIAGDVYADDRDISPDATVEGTVSGLARFTAGFGWAAVAVGALLWISIAASILVLGLLLLWAAPRGADAVADAATSRLGPAVGWGFLVLIGLPIVAVLLLVTVLGIPLGILLLLALALILAIGQTAGSWVLGRRLASGASRPVAFLAGWAIVSGLSLVPVVGGLAALAAVVVGLGAIVVATARTRRGPAAPLPTVPPIPG